MPNNTSSFSSNNWSKQLCIDGLLNPTVYTDNGITYAFGRRKERGPLLLCTIDPDVKHVAVVEQPDGFLLEDPRYLGQWNECHYFIGANAYAFFSPDHPHNHIYQSIFALNKQHIICDVWNVPSKQPVEKNWVPLGTIDEEGQITLLHSHMTGLCIRVHCKTHQSTEVAALGTGLKTQQTTRAMTNVRGGTPLCRLSGTSEPKDATTNANWWGFGHVTQEMDREHQHPHLGYRPCPVYRTTIHEYDATLCQIVREATCPALFGAHIEYMTGLCTTSKGLCVSMGWNDCSAVFLWCKDASIWWKCAQTLKTPLKMPSHRLSYADRCIPLPRTVSATPPPQASTHHSTKTPTKTPTKTSPNRPTICLNMIVKNESRIIDRLIDTVLPIIDCYCICDTGSTDDTRERIRRRFKAANIPGRVVEHPFVSFGHNRSFAIRAAHDLADYLLLVDADMKLVIDSSFDAATLTADVYTIHQGNAHFSYKNVRLLRTTIGATCIGSTHEYYGYPSTCTVGHLDTLRIDDIGDGGCKQNKFERDIRLLNADIAVDPRNERAHFYIANSYKDTRQWENAITHYQKRIDLGGWHEEIWYSYYAMGKCYLEQKQPSRAIHTWLNGYQHHPHRAENLFEIVKYYREHGKSELAAQFYQWAVKIPLPTQDSLFIHQDIYHFRLAYEFLIFYYYLRDKSQFPKTAIHDALYTVIAHDCEVQNALSNYKFYARAMCKQKGVRVTPLEIPSLQELDPSLSSTYVASTPSSIDLSPEHRLINIRYNNTPMNDKYEYVMTESREKTYNVCCHLRRSNGESNEESNAQTHSYTSVVMQESELERDTSCFAGRQDIRLFQPTPGKILYTATVCTKEQGQKVFRIEYGAYDAVHHQLKGKLIRSPTGATCEKNWCLFTTDTGEIRCVYSWSPLVIGRIENEHFIEDTRLDVPLLRVARGSSHGVIVPKDKKDEKDEKDASELWFLVHMVSYESPRRYYHAVVVFNRNATSVVRVSYPFTLEGKPIEYCGDLRVTETTLTMHYSVRDANSRRIDIPRSQLQWKTNVRCHSKPTKRRVNVMYWQPTVFPTPPDGHAHGNFGDELSPVVTQWLLDTDAYTLTCNQPYCPTQLVCIGSYLHNTPDGSYVFGTGIRTLPCPTFDSLHVAAVRGPLTKQHLMAANPHIHVPDTFGDPALLLPRVYQPEHLSELANKIAVVPHIGNYTKYASSTFSTSSTSPIREHYHLICPCSHWKQVLNELCSCRAVVSSSLHGLICADAYGLPNVWLDEYPLEEGHFKFHDYFASQGRPIQRIQSLKDISPEMVHDVKHELWYTGGNTIDVDTLMNAFPFSK